MDDIATKPPDVEPADAGAAPGFSSLEDDPPFPNPGLSALDKVSLRKALRQEPDEYSDQWTADEVAKVIKDKVRYLPGVGEFYVWDGSAWTPDEHNRAELHVSRAMCAQAGRARQQATNAPSDSEREAGRKFARAAQGLPMRNRVLRLVKENPLIVQHVDDFDTEPLALNTPAGPVNLWTGELDDPDPSLLFSQRTAVEPQDGEPTRWLDFLAETTLNDDELMAFIQRWVGYCATGLNDEKYIFCGFGPTDSGKSVLMGVLRDVFGSYCATIPQGTLLAKGGSRHPTDLATFVRARLATSSEVPAGGSKWRADVVKAISGGDPVEVRRMREDFSEVEPTSRLMLFSNHLPATGDDGAMRRRIFVVPFDNRVPLEEQDKQLGDRLVEKEGGQILSWIIEGAAAYLRDGLEPFPSCVQQATEEYRESEDRVSRFLQDRCELDLEYEDSSKRLYSAWQTWCLENGHPKSEIGARKTFTRMLGQEGEDYGIYYSTHAHDSETGKRARGFKGVRVKPSNVFEADPGKEAMQEHKRQRGEA